MRRTVAPLVRFLTFGLAAVALGAPLGASAGPASGIPWRNAPLGLAAAARPAPDPLRELRGATVVSATTLADSSVQIDARSAAGRPLRFVLPAGAWRDLAGQLAAAAVNPELARRPGASEGRGSLVLYQTMLGLGYYGWAVPKVLHVTDEKGQIGLYMLTASASFGIPYLLTRNADISGADSRMAGYGASRGLALGLFVDNALATERDYASYMLEDGGFDYLRYDLDRQHDAQRKYGLGMLGSIAGSFAGYYASGALGDSPARCEFVGACGDYGAALGIATAYTFGWYDQDTHANRHARGALGTSAMAAGLATGAMLSQRVSLGTGDSYVLRDAIVLGAQAGLPIAYALSDEHGEHRARAVARGGVIGSLAGLALGRRLIADDDYSESEGLLQTASQLAGGMFALGVTYLVSSRDAFGEGRGLTVSAIGSTAGFALMNRALRHRHRVRGTR